MKKRLLSALLALAMLFALPAPLGTAAAAASVDGDYGWPEMSGDLAMRVTEDGAEVTQLVVGKQYSLQVWLQEIAPYGVVLPLCWDPAVVTVVNAATGKPISSGRKTEGEAAGFRAGSKCYESGYDPATYEPLYWNGRPVYSAIGEDPAAGYPYLDNELGHYRFFYYVSSPTAPAQAQLFLEISFRVNAKGDPDFHVATIGDGPGRYDPAQPSGVSVLLSSGDDGAVEVPYGVNVTCPELTVLTQKEYEEEGSKPFDPQAPVTPPAPVAPDGEAVPSVPAELVNAQHLTYFPYDTALETSAIAMERDGIIPEDGGYVLPANRISDAVNSRSGKQSLLVRMPEKIIKKPEYALTFRLQNIDDMASNGLAMLYVETPWGFVGLNTAILAAQTPDDATACLHVKEWVDGIGLSFTVNGERVSGFSGPALRVILPYDDARWPDGTFALPVGIDVFGDGSAVYQPLNMTRVDKDKGALIVLSPSVCDLMVTDSPPQTFTDLGGVSWAAESIAMLARRSVVNGTGNGAFDPQRAVTRGQFAKMLVCALGMYAPASEGERFTDTPAGALLTPYITASRTVGISKGRTNGSFGMNDTISRQDMAVMAHRALQLWGVQTAQDGLAAAFADDGDIAAYAKEAVYDLAAAGILNGMGGGRFAPAATASRAQAAKIIAGILELAGESW